jgi:hypothetical protein
LVKLLFYCQKIGYYLECAYLSCVFLILSNCINLFASENIQTHEAAGPHTIENSL